MEILARNNVPYRFYDFKVKDHYTKRVLVEARTSNEAKEIAQDSDYRLEEEYVWCYETVKHFLINTNVSHSFPIVSRSGVTMHSVEGV